MVNVNNKNCYNVITIKKRVIVTSPTYVLLKQTCRSSKVSDEIFQVCIHGPNFISETSATKEIICVMFFINYIG